MKSLLVISLFLFGIKGSVGSDVKSSLTFVIDDTGSMRDDINEVKKGANAIFDTVMNSKSSQIEDFVLVTFNDPKTKRRAKTKDRMVFKDALNEIVVHGGIDCPEYAMSGIELALKNSREGSSLYVFTDASATDHEKYDEVVALSQKMGCQIVFVLTGICSDFVGKEAPHYKVYKKLANATNGQVFHLHRDEIGDILDYVKLSIESRKTPLASKTFHGGHNAFDVNVDATMKELIISVSGKDASVSVTDSGGTKWPTTDVTKLSDVDVVKVVGVTPDVYTVEVDSKEEIHVVVSASTSVHFQHGFSTVKPSDITDTVKQPVPGVKSHLSIKLSTEGTDVELESVQILDMDGEVILETPLKLVDKAEQFYTSEQIIPPGHLFRVAIKGHDVKTKSLIRRLSLTPVQPQEFKRDSVETKAPVVMCKSDVTAAYGKPLQMMCKVSGWPKPNVIWTTDDPSASLTHFESTVELPYKYVSLVEISDVRNNATHSCKAVNSEGEAIANIQVHTKMPNYFKVVAAPKDITVEYQKSAVIPCKVDAYPPATVSWLKGGRPLNHDSNVKVSADGTELTISSMEPYIVENYICEARNSLGRRFFKFRLNISGLEKPEIDKTVYEVRVVQNTKADIRCPIVKGIPVPSIEWYYKAAGGIEFVRTYDTSDTIHVDKVDSTYAGTYRCMAINKYGDFDFHEIDLIVEYEPSIPKRYNSVMTVNDGETVSLKCPAVGAPAPQITWRYQGRVVRSIGRYSIYTDGTLRFSAMPSDEGKYECEARNSLGAAKITIQLNINVLPFVEPPKKSSIEQMEGLPVTLPCRVDGFPKPRITWLHRSYDSGIERELPPSDATGRLRFNSIRLDQSGEYTCVAANSRGSKNITYSVSVLAPPTIHYTTKEFEGVVDDMQLRIPCNNTGNPKPEITWTYEGYHLASGSKWFTIGNDGSLIIKNLNVGSRGTYTCKASNKYGKTQEDFEVTVRDFPDPGFLSDEVQLKEGSSKIIPCSIPYKPTDRLRWFKDGQAISSNVLELRDITERDSGVYSCRVSYVDRPAQTGSTRVEVGFKPRFEYNDDKNIPFAAGGYALMDCTASGVPEPQVKWYHDGKEITINKFKFELEMRNDNDNGRYTCVVSNMYGEVQQDFFISTFECLIDVTNKYEENEPLILTPYDKLTNFKTKNGFMHIPKDEVVKFSCPSSFNSIRARELMLTCENEDQFVQQSSGRRFAYSDLKCRDKWQPIVRSTRVSCRKDSGQIFNVGFEIKGKFERVYEVCVDRASKNPIYTKLDMEPLPANVVSNDTEWFDDGYPVDLDGLYDCSNQNTGIESILNKEFHREGCCFAKRMLVNPLDVASGLPQAATFTHFNVAPQWSTCNSENWEDVERRIRSLVASADRPLQVWTGTAEDLRLPDASYKQKNVVISSRGKNVQVPKYLWKLVQDRATEASLAIIQVNVPDLKLAEARHHMLCNDVCKQADWMKSRRWRNINHGFTYCCSLREFERAFRLYGEFPNYEKLLLEASDIPDDHYLHAI